MFLVLDNFLVVETDNRKDGSKLNKNIKRTYKWSDFNFEEVIKND